MEPNKSTAGSSSHRAHEATLESFVLLGRVPVTADEMPAAL